MFTIIYDLVSGVRDMRQWQKSIGNAKFQYDTGAAKNPIQATR